MTNFNIKPFWDDLFEVDSDGKTPAEKYNRILFKPGVAVQARELTQIQSILQEQIKRFGDNILQNGTRVANGELKLNKSKYIKVFPKSGTSIAEISKYTNKIIDDGNGNNGKIIISTEADASDPLTFFIDDSSNKFNSGNFTVIIDNITQTFEITESGDGKALIASIEKGVYFVDGFFVTNEEQRIVVSKYGTNVDTEIGFNIIENLNITSNDDITLKDRAQGYGNYNSDGASRYKIDLKLSIDKSDKFVSIVKIKNGEIENYVEDKKTTYNIIGDELARRTFDESGNYVVDEFLPSIKYENANNSHKYFLELDPGKAYVNGYEVENNGTKIEIQPVSSTKLDENIAMTLNDGNYIEVDASNVNKIPELCKTSLKILDSTNTAIGSVFVKNIEVIKGTTNTIRMYIYNRIMNGDKLFKDAAKIKMSTDWTADLLSPGEIKDSNKGSNFLFKLPYDAVITLDEDERKQSAKNYDIRYITYKHEDSLTVGSDGVIQLLTTVDYPDFVSSKNILIIAADKNDSNKKKYVEINDNNFDKSNHKITGLNSKFRGQTCEVIYPQKHTTKTATIVSLKQNGLDELDVPTKGNTKVLTKEFGKGLISIKAKSAQNSSDPDYKDYFEFDDGQTESYFDKVSIKLIKDLPSSYPSGQKIVVKYEYYDKGNGDFITVDSYKDGISNITLKDIPSFKGQSLANYIDFRPNKGDNNKTGRFPINGSDFETSVWSYLGRKDNVIIKSNGQFDTIKGQPARYPQLPEDKKDSLTLFNIDVPPYIFNKDLIQVSKLNTKRYTMNDLSKFEKRIDNLEYYSSLSLLEQNIISKNVTDSNGNTKFKSGFFVDSFDDITRADLSSDSKMSTFINTKSGILQPRFNTESLKLEFDKFNSTNLKLWHNNLLTLNPITEKTIIRQSLSSGAMNVNPYGVFGWNGTIKLTPESDPFVKENTNTKNLQESLTRTSGSFSRTTSLVSKTTSRSVETTSFITKRPFMRGRYIYFKAENLRPNTEHFLFFGNELVDSSKYTKLDNDTSFNDNDLDISSGITHANASYRKLTTNDSGTLYGKFLLEKDTHQVGSKAILIVDRNILGSQDATSTSNVIYKASNDINTINNTITTTETTTWSDPIAQSIKVDIEGGIILSKLDLFVSSKPGVGYNFPLNVHIVEMKNGYPSQKRLNGSLVTKTRDDVNVDGTSTTFEFKNPVHIKNGVEYAIVVWSNSIDYSVEIAEHGKNDKSGRLINKQPYVGSLFKSQNSSTWTADQNKDLKFTLYRYEFDTNNVGTLKLKNVGPTTNIEFQMINPKIQEFLVSDTQSDWRFGDLDIVLNNKNKVFKNNSISTGQQSFLIDGNFRTSITNMSPIIDLNTATVNLYDNIIDNNKTIGFSNAIYASKEIALNDSSSLIKIYMDINKPKDADVKVYIKTAADMNQLLNDSDLSYIEIKPTNNIQTVDSDEYVETEFEKSLDKFGSYQLFAVLSASNKARIPSISNLRSITLI